MSTADVRAFILIAKAKQAVAIKCSCNLYAWNPLLSKLTCALHGVEK